ncbi:MAG: deoxyribose-phosphate aldolase [Eubacteriales bacterium]|nr:deoxyribose-phosphate aldolase [Eubacteriales bacterium]
MNSQELAKLIDHTLLYSDAKSTEIEKLCEEAVEYGFASVCVQPYYVKLAAEKLQGTAVKVCTVIGFPLGQNKTATKVFEAREAIADGASELDMVINLAALKNADWVTVEADIKAVVEAAGGLTVKVILECSMLSELEVIKASAIARRAGADFVKTSTGFQGRGATVDDIERMNTASGSPVLVKASGGIRDYATALAMVEAGASRIGTSSGVIIMEEARRAEEA